MKIVIFILVSQIMVFQFLYKKDFWHILVKLIVLFLVSRPCNLMLIIFLFWSVMVFSKIGFSISRLIKKKARNPGKSQMFAENLVQRFK